MKSKKAAGRTEGCLRDTGQAMDGFVKPLTGFSKSGRADEAKEKAAYDAYLKTLASADS
jgi:hypothetical protein